MPDAKLPKLAEGSRWEGDHCEVVDEWGGHVRAFACDNGKNIVEIEADRSGCHAALAEDTLAVIRRAGLDPLAIAAAELVRMLESGRITLDCTPETHADYMCIKRKLEALL